MNSIDMKKVTEDMQKYIDLYRGNKELINLYESFKRISQQQLASKSLIESIVSLIDSIERMPRDVSIIFVKNENDFYNLCYFRQEVKFKVRDIASMDNLIEKIKECEYDGVVLENLSTEDIVNFLKAYYLYRKDVEESKTANNQVKEYNQQCLEMSSIEDKYMDLNSDYEEELRNIILYPNKVLPYSLEYLDDKKRRVQDSWHYMNNNKLSFSTIYQEVCDNRFIGLSLRKYRGYWN